MTFFSKLNFQKSVCHKYKDNYIIIVNVCITFWESWFEVWEEGLIVSSYLCHSGSMIERQCIKLEIWGSNPSLDTNFSLNIYHVYDQLIYKIIV